MLDQDRKLLDVPKGKTLNRDQVAHAAEALASGSTRASVARTLGITDRALRRLLANPDSPLSKMVARVERDRENAAYHAARRQWLNAGRFMDPPAPEPVAPRDRRLGPEARPEKADPPAVAESSPPGTVILGQAEAKAADEDARILDWLINGPAPTDETSYLDRQDALRGRVSPHARRRWNGAGGRRTPAIQVIGVGGSYYDISNIVPVGFEDPFPRDAYSAARD